MMTGLHQMMNFTGKCFNFPRSLALGIKAATDNQSHFNERAAAEKDQHLSLELSRHV